MQYNSSNNVHNISDDKHDYQYNNEYNYLRDNDYHGNDGIDDGDNTDRDCEYYE